MKNYSQRNFVPGFAAGAVMGEETEQTIRKTNPFGPEFSY
jgi:hypothetical protein